MLVRPVLSHSTGVPVEPEVSDELAGLAVALGQRPAPQILIRQLDVGAREERQVEPAFLIDRGVGIVAGLAKAFAVEGHGLKRVAQQFARLAELRRAQALGRPPLALLQLKQQGEQDVAGLIGYGGPYDSRCRGIGDRNIERHRHGRPA